MAMRTVDLLKDYLKFKTEDELIKFYRNYSEGIYPDSDLYDVPYLMEEVMKDVTKYIRNLNVPFESQDRINWDYMAEL